jgi:hypothetical protein
LSRPDPGLGARRREKIQISSDNGAIWTDVTQNTATSWSFADGTTRPASFTYQIIDGAGARHLISTNRSIRTSIPIIG